MQTRKNITKGEVEYHSVTKIDRMERCILRMLETWSISDIENVLDRVVSIAKENAYLKMSEGKA